MFRILVLSDILSECLTLTAIAEIKHCDLVHFDLVHCDLVHFDLEGNIFTKVFVIIIRKVRIGFSPFFF